MYLAYFFILFSFVSGLFSKEESLSVRPGKDYALFIAVDQYDTWRDLRNPVKDANAVARELRDRYGFSTKVLSNPTKREIYAELDAYANRSYGEDSQLMIFFSGHGYYKNRTTEGFFIPKDGQSSRNDPYGETYIPHSRLRDIIAVNPCKHILLVIDACFSGTFDRRIALGRSEKQVAAYVKKGLQYKSRLYLTSGGKEYVSDGSDHSPFTRGFLSALRMDENGLVSFPELVATLDYIQPTPRYGEFEGNEPGGNFYLISENASIPGQQQRFNRPTRGGGREDAAFPRKGNVNLKGQNYSTIQYAAGGLTWMTENLNYRVADSWCYDDKTSNCSKYGRLYTWEAAKRACASLGPGWRLPTDQEWRDLVKRFGGADGDASDGGKAAYQVMIEGGDSGFSARLGGYHYSRGDIDDLGDAGFYWSATELGSDRAWFYIFDRGSGELYRDDWYDKSTGLSCRCVQGAPSNGND